MTEELPDPEKAAEASTADAVSHATEIRMASSIYGLIIASSVLAAGADDDNIVYVSLSVLVTLVVYWLAETYARVMAVRQVNAQPVTWSRTRHDLSDGWPLVSASFVPLVAVVLSAILGASVSTAQTVGMICATVLLFSSGVIAGRRRGSTGFRLIMTGVIAASFGAILIVLKTSIHH